MTWSLFDPEGQLSRLAEATDAQRRDLREAIGQLLDDPFRSGVGLEVHEMRGVAKGDEVDVFIGYLPHGWILTYEVHLRHREGGGPPGVVIVALLKIDEVFGP